MVKGKVPALIPWLRATSHQHPVLLATALSAEKRKLKKYEDVANLFKFVPSSWRPLVLSEKKLWTQTKRIETSEELRSQAYLTQRISIAIQQGNAGSIFAIVSTSNILQEIYYL